MKSPTRGRVNGQIFGEEMFLGELGGEWMRGMGGIGGIWAIGS